MPESRYVLGVAYQAGRDPAIARGLDGARDYFTEAELEKAAWSFLKNGAVGGLLHFEGTEAAATIVESYIWRSDPWEINGTVVRKGDWLLGAICDEESWALVKAGKLTGFSPQGRMHRRPARSE